jgi:uncharacterized protein YfdQ (DUF2303 family)
MADQTVKFPVVPKEASNPTIEAAQYLVGIGQGRGLVQQAVRNHNMGIEAPFVVTRDGERVVSLAEMLPDTPPRKVATVNITSVSSFCAYVNEHKGKNTRIFAQTMTAPYFLTAIMDYHGQTDIGTPGWCEHRAILNLTHTREWEKWKANNDRAFPQTEFALFIEDNLNDVFDPDAGVLMDMATRLEGTQETKFRGRVRLDNGDFGIVCEQDTKMGGGDGATIAIPKEIILRMAIFRGMQWVEVKARLRVVFRAPNVTIGYSLIRADAMVDSAVASVNDFIAAETGVTVFQGQVSVLTK